MPDQLVSPCPGAPVPWQRSASQRARRVPRTTRPAHASPRSRHARPNLNCGSARHILKLELTADALGMPTNVGELQGGQYVYVFRSVGKNPEVTAAHRTGAAPPTNERVARRLATGRLLV